MADILKGTCWWASNPTWTQVDNTTIGGLTLTPLTAAGAHDASDATKLAAGCGGDGVAFEGDMNVYTSHALTAAPAGGIKFVRLKVRARFVITAGAGTANVSAMLRLSGLDYEAGGISAFAVTGTYQNFTMDMAVDPATGLPWTVAAFNGHTWGLNGHVVTSNFGVWATVAALEVAEYTVEVWGEDVTATVTGASSDSLATVQAALPGDRDGSLIVPLLMTLDGGSVPAVARSFKTGLNDQSTATADVYTTAGTGTETKALFGAASQGVVGSSGAGNGINGTGVIAGIKLYAIARISKQAAGTITNVRFGTAMGLQALVTPATIRDFDQPLTADMFERLESVLVTVGPTAQPFEWGNGTNSVWASMFGWTLNWTLAGVGTKQMEIAEAWVEILGPVGASDTSNIELTLSIGLAPKIMQSNNVR